MKFDLDLNYATYFNQSLQDPLDPPLDTAEYFASEFNANGYLLVPLGGGKSSFRAHFHYGWLVEDWENVAQALGLIRFERAVDMQLGLAYRGRYDSPWGVHVSFIPGLAGSVDLTDLSSDEVTIEGGAWLLRYFPSGLIVGLGGYRTFDFGEPEIWPSLLVEYDDPDGRYYVKGLLPSTAEAFYYVWRTLKLGLVFDIRGRRYYQRTDDFPGLADPFKVNSVITLGAGIGYAFDNKLAFRIDGGYILDRKLRILDGDDTGFSTDPKRGPFLRATMYFGGDL